MSKTKWQTKKKYNDKVYARIAVDLPRDLVETFKAKCKTENISQATVIKEAVEDFLEEEKQ